MSVHPIITNSSKLVCGAIHAHTGGICKRPHGHVAQHTVTNGAESKVWTKDPLSCICPTSKLCPEQLCVISIPVGQRVAEAANEDKGWMFEDV